MKRYYLTGDYKGKYLTARQSECARALMEGNTAKQIAKIMCISPRTVESYILILKDKFDVHRQVELMKKLFNTTFV